MRIILLGENDFIVADHLAGATFSKASGNRANIEFDVVGRRGISYGPTIAEPIMREVFIQLQAFVTGRGGMVFEMASEIKNAELTVSSKV